MLSRHTIQYTAGVKMSRSFVRLGWSKSSSAQLQCHRHRPAQLSLPVVPVSDLFVSRPPSSRFDADTRVNKRSFWLFEVGKSGKQKREGDHVAATGVLNVKCLRSVRECVRSDVIRMNDLC